MNMACAILTAVVGQARVIDQLPSELLERVRNPGYNTSQIEWTLSWIGGTDDGLVERFVTRRAGEDLWQSNLGDDNGFHPTVYTVPSANASYEERFPIPREELAGTQNTLLHAGRLWYMPRAEEPSSGLLKKASEPNYYIPFDFAIGGIAPAWRRKYVTNALGLHGSFLAGLRTADVYDGYAGGFRTITAESGSSRFVWYLDSAQGGGPVRAEYYRDDELLHSSHTDYRQMGDRWFVETIRFYKGYDRSTPSHIVQVQQASFDQPWHMQSITPSDIGVHVGTQFENGRFFWDGTELLLRDEWYELVYVHGLRPDREVLQGLTKDVGKSVEQYLEGMDKVAAWMREKYFAEHGTRPWLEEVVLFKRPEEKDEWDVYVEKFIEKHKLTGEPLERAKDILQRSKKMRDARLRKNAVEIRKAQREGDKKKLAHYEGITRRIFDEVLVRTLNRLVPKSPPDL